MPEYAYRHRVRYPCYKCTDARHEGCHDTCEEFLAVKKKIIDGKIENHKKHGEFANYVKCRR